MHRDCTRVGVERSRPEKAENTRATARQLARAMLRKTDHGELHAPYGERPRLCAPGGDECGFVSLTHTRGIVAAALSGQPVGVDVERLDRRVGWQALARAHFSPQEQQWLDGQPENRCKSSFLGLWTLKEAWLKAGGLGVWKLGQACFTPREGEGWLLPGQDLRGECVCVGSNLVISAVWQGEDTLQWQEKIADGGWAALPHRHVWHACSSA